MGISKRSHLNFEIIGHSQKCKFMPQGEYELVNKELAELMVADCVNRMYEGTTFGSGWPQSPPMDYPQFKV